MGLETVIGLEIHIKLNSQNKLFCRCENHQDFESVEQNSNICPVCTGQPGGLPVLNKEPLEKAILLGLALGCHVNHKSHFERKSYFYPDLPPGYQITQLAVPTNVDGEVAFFVDKEFEQVRRVRIRDAHIETDTGKSIREGGKVLIDYNRAGTPLVEIVSHPDFRSGDEVVAFLKELQRIAKYNNIGDADMEKGQLRVDVNISLRPEGDDTFGTRVELKNMNSYSAIMRAIDHEVARQGQIIMGGGVVEQQTRSWDDSVKDSHCMRSKEDAMDYRYMPEPDLPLLQITDELIDQIRTQLVKSPFDRIEHYKKSFGFNKEYINGLITDKSINNYFELTIAEGYDPKETAKWIVGPIARWLNEKQFGIHKLSFSHEDFISFLTLIKDGKISSNQAKEVMKIMIETGSDPLHIVEKKGFKPIDAGQITIWLNELFTSKPDLLEDLRAGNMKPLGFITGQIMKMSQGSADPKTVQEVIKTMV